MNTHVHPFRKMLVGACILSLIALALMVWSMLDPAPIPVVVAMSAGQIIGTISFLIFIYVVFIDLRVKRRIARTTPESEPESMRPPDAS
jgi:hypothetical protein